MSFLNDNKAAGRTLNVLRDGKWECDPACGGSCCQMVNDGWVNVLHGQLFFALKKDIGPPPRLDRGDGTCKHFSGGRCSIYSSRPLVCRIREVGEALGMDVDSIYPGVCQKVFDRVQTKKGREVDEQEQQGQQGQDQRRGSRAGGGSEADSPHD